MNNMEISSVEFCPFIHVRLGNDKTESLVMYVRIHEENTDPRIQATICGTPGEKNWTWKWPIQDEPMPEWVKPYFDKGMEIINAQNMVCAAPGSMLTKEFLKERGLENAEYRGRMSDFAISQFNEKTNCFGGDDYPEDTPYPSQETYCARSIHYWFKVTDLMWEHWVVR